MPHNIHLQVKVHHMIWMDLGMGNMYRGRDINGMGDMDEWGIWMCGGDMA